MLTLNSALEQLQAGNFHDRWDVAKSFPSFGEAAVNPLIRLLQDPDSDPELQWVIAKVLGEFSQSQAMVALGKLLHTTEDEDLLHIAAYTLAQKGIHAIPALSRAVEQDETALAAIQALAQIRNPEVIAPLLQGVDSQKPEVRAAALEALSLWHDARVFPLLLQSLQDPSALVRQVAVMGLGYCGHRADPHDWVGQLSPLIWDINVGVCKQAILALGRLATTAAIEALITALPKVMSPECRRLLIQTLGRLGSVTTVAGLKSALASPAMPEDRLVIVEALARTEAVSVRPLASQVLVEMLADAQADAYSGQLKCAIANSLGQLQQSAAIPSLIQLLADTDMGVQLHAIAALKQLDAEHAHTQLLDLSTHQHLAPELAVGIQLALQEW